MSVRKDKHSPVTEGFLTDEQSSYPVSIAGSVLVFFPPLLMLLIKDFCEMSAWILTQKVPGTLAGALHTVHLETHILHVVLKQGSVLI